MSSNSSFTFPPPPPPPPKATSSAIAREGGHAYSQVRPYSSPGPFRGGVRGRGRGEHSGRGRGALGNYGYSMDHSMGQRSWRPPQHSSQRQIGGQNDAQRAAPSPALPSYQGTPPSSGHHGKLPNDSNSQSYIPPSQHGGYAASSDQYPNKRPKTFENSEYRRGNSNVSLTTRSAGPRPKAAPAVPSFLSVSLPADVSSGAAGGPKKQKRSPKNLLGLTPRPGDEDKSEDEDVDEEAMLKDVSTASSTEQLQFSYKGQTSHLGSADDIAAWIEERRKRFPTKQRIDEKKADTERRQQAFRDRREALKEVHEAKRTKNAPKSKSESERVRRPSVSGLEASRNDDTKDELLKKVEEQERMLAAMKAQLAKSHQRKREPRRAHPLNPTAPMDQESKAGLVEVKDEEDDAKQTGISEVSCQPFGAKTYTEGLDTIDADGRPISSPALSSSPIDSADVTSSSGSSSSSYLSSSDSSSDADDPIDEDELAEDQPEEEPSKAPSEATLQLKSPSSSASRPERKPRLCRNFLSRGKCKYPNCRFLHEMPPENTGRGNRGTRGDRGEARGNRGNGEARSGGRRKGLFQLMVEQEEEQERLRVVQSIKRLGEAGFLDEDSAG